jgi:hypothetical protein
MTAQVAELLSQRLIRGNSVVVADSFGKAANRGQTMIVASKTTVKCNGKGRCAGDWCIGLSVFLTKKSSSKKDKEMGWRGGTVKVCLTHLKDEEGRLLLTPPALRAAVAPVTSTDRPANARIEHEGVVTWEDLACASADRDLDLVIFLARKLKSENEKLKSKVIEAQDNLIEGLKTG